MTSLSKKRKKTCRRGKSEGEHKFQVNSHARVRRPGPTEWDYKSRRSCRSRREGLHFPAGAAVGPRGAEQGGADRGGVCCPLPGAAGSGCGLTAGARAPGAGLGDSGGGGRGLDLGSGGGGGGADGSWKGGRGGPPWWRGAGGVREGEAGAARGPDT